MDNPVQFKALEHLEHIISQYIVTEHPNVFIKFSLMVQKSYDGGHHLLNLIASGVSYICPNYEKCLNYILLHNITVTYISYVTYVTQKGLCSNGTKARLLHPKVRQVIIIVANETLS